MADVPQHGRAGSPALPPRLLNHLDLDGWTVWLAYHAGEPAAAGYTFDDGTTVHLYWLAALPRFRRLGLARAILATAINAWQDRIFILVATDVGWPLYDSLGFSVKMITWYMRPPLEHAVAAPEGTHAKA